LKILHVSTEDIAGGAGRATYRLHTGLRRLGYESSMYVIHRGSKSKDSMVTAFNASMDWTSRIRRRIRRRRIARDFARYGTSRPAGFEIFSDDRSEFGDDVAKHFPPCDVVNLHWIARFVDYEAFFSAVPKRTPVVWRIADMNPITGGCHYDEGCGKYLVGCGACPQLGSNDPDDLSRQVWKRKQEIFGGVEPHRLHFVALNRWMASNLAHHPFLNKFPVTIIPNGLDTDVFAPRDRKIAREILGLPQEATIILFVASNVQIRYKGFLQLTEALSGLKGQNNLLLMSVGTKLVSDLGNHHTNLGHINDDRLLALTYNAADVFVVPSLQDNSPNTVLEAMACGIPVVGFETGGIPDMVRDGVTGLLAPCHDVAVLRAAIEDLIRKPSKREEMGVNSRRVALHEYSLVVQARRYAELYQSLLRSNSRSLP
jgi:glycosyltransferase involved in cell wall biosynthesis